MNFHVVQFSNTKQNQANKSTTLKISSDLSSCFLRVDTLTYSRHIQTILSHMKMDSKFVRNTNWPAVSKVKPMTVQGDSCECLKSTYVN